MHSSVTSRTKLAWPATRILAAWGIVLLAFGCSVLLRIWHHDAPVAPGNLDASYHVLLTVQAYNETPAAVHAFLPLVTLGHPSNRGISLGASVPDSGGVYYYTSFPPLGFILPWLFLTVFRAEPWLYNLMALNLAIHLVATLLFAGLLARVASLARTSLAPLEESAGANPCPAPPDPEAAVILGAGLLYLFAAEALYTHGIIYWHHSPFQVLLLVQLLALTKLVGRPMQPAIRAGSNLLNSPCAGVYLTAAFLGCCLEWTGYLVAGLNTLLWIGLYRHTRHRLFCRLAWGTAVAAGVAALVIGWHFSVVLGFSEFTSALGKRMWARSTRALLTGLPKLATNYFYSFGLLPVLSLAGLWMFLRRHRRGAQHLPFYATLIALTLPVLENVLLTNHALVYAFDRMKAILPLTALVMLGWVTLERRHQTWLAAAVLLVIASNLAIFLGRLREEPLGPAYRAQLALLDNLPRDPGVLYASTADSRGWSTMTLDRNIREGRSVESLRAELVHAGEDACGGVLLVKDPVTSLGIYREGATLHNYFQLSTPGFYYLKEAVVLNKDGTTSIRTAAGLDGPADYARYLRLYASPDTAKAP